MLHPRAWNLSPQLALRGLGWSWLASALTLWVFEAHRFSHSPEFLRVLEGRAAWGWALVLLYAVLLKARCLLAPQETERWLTEPRRFWGVTAVGFGVLASPFMNAYFTHVTHPALAWAWVWLLWPWVELLAARAGRAARRLFASGWLPWAAASVAAGFIFLQAYRRHLWFGSGGKDLGLFHQSVWLLSRFEWPHNTVMGMSAFADHMEFIDVLAAPLQWLWPDAGALLLFQSLCVGSAVLPVMWLVRQRLGPLGPAGTGAAGLALSAALILSPDAQHAVMFDFNPTTCGAAFIPWVVWGIGRRHPAAFWIPLMLLALSKENLVLYAGGLCLALAHRAEHRRRALGGLLVCAALFVVEMKVLFPLFREGGFRHLRFHTLGQTPTEILRSVLTSPWQAFALLLVPGGKINGLLVWLSAFAWVSVLAPRFGWAALPALLERFWSTHPNRWWGHHYGAGLAMVGAMAALEGLALVGARYGRRGMALALGAVLMSSVLVSHQARWGRSPLWLWRAPYFTTAQDRADAQAVLGAVPPHASVAAQNHLLPHLSARREIYEITRPVRAQVVVLDGAQDAWPFGRDYVPRLAAQLWGQGYRPVACQGQAMVLRRDKGQAGQVQAGQVQANEVQASDVQAGQVQANEVQASDVQAGNLHAAEVECAVLGAWVRAHGTAGREHHPPMQER